jgi:N-acetylneuraminate synthase/N,N'-diacetyllegionaminate synthase
VEAEVKDFPRHIEVAGRRIGPGEPCYVIAEGGVSHFGQMAKARQLIDMAKDGGADVYKTQHYRTDRLVGPSAPDWRERLRSKEMPDAAIGEMQAYCCERQVPFLCTPHDEEALEFLDKVLDIPAFKIGSGEVENWPFLANVARRGKPMIVSTGMYRIDQIKDMIKVVADNGCTQLAILHCVTSYPADPSLINLKVMDQIREFFTGPVGYSDHTEGTAVPLAAVALGADIIEKHITIDRDVPNAQDWKVSCDPSNFARFVADIRAIEQARGGGPKVLTEYEQRSILWARKSLTAAVDIPAGATITENMLIAQRPGSGMPASRLSELLGRQAAGPIACGELLRPEMLR